MIKSRSILFPAVLFLSLALSGFIPPNAVTNNFSIRYTVDGTNPQSGKVEITVLVENYPNSYFRLETLKPHPEAVSFSNFQAWDQEGKEFPIKSIGASDCSQPWDFWGCEVWQIDNSNNHSFKITYEAQPGYDPTKFSDAQIGRLEKDYMIFSGYSIFVVPKTNLTYDVSVNFSLPGSWKLYTVWEKSENGYIPSIPGPDIRENLNYSGFAAGSSFTVYEDNIGGCLTQILISKEFSEKDSQNIADEVFDGLTYQTNMFGVTPADRFLVVITKSGGTRYDSIEWINSIERSRDPNSGIPDYEPIFHGSHHRWNAWLNGNWDVENSTKWMHEGSAEYYAVKIPYILSTKIHSNSFKGDFIDYYQKYLKLKDSPVSAVGVDSMIYYRKGALVVSLLDYEINKRTSGEKTFDDFYALLFQKYSAFKNNGHAKWCNNSCLIKELKNFTGSDFTDFFKAYVFGVELPIEWLRSDQDSDGLYAYDEFMLSTDPEKPDTDGDGFNDGSEKQQGTDPLSQNSFPLPTATHAPTATITPTPTVTITPVPTTTKIILNITPDSNTNKPKEPLSFSGNRIYLIPIVVIIIAIAIFWIAKRKKNWPR